MFCTLREPAAVLGRTCLCASCSMSWTGTIWPGQTCLQQLESDQLVLMQGSGARHVAKSSLSLQVWNQASGRGPLPTVVLRPCLFFTKVENNSKGIKPHRGDHWSERRAQGREMKGKGTTQEGRTHTGQDTVSTWGLTDDEGRRTALLLEMWDLRQQAIIYNIA